MCRSLFGILHFSLGSISLCICLAVLTVIPDAPFFPNPFLMMFAFQTIASSLALLVVTVPLTCMIAMDQSYFLHSRFTDIPGHLFSFFLFFILSMQLMITLRRIIRTWSEDIVDNFYKWAHLLHVQLGISLIFAFSATTVLSRREDVAYFSSSLMSWRIHPLEWHITLGFSALFLVVLLLLNLPTLRLMIVRKSLDMVVNLDEEDPFSQWRHNFHSLLRHLLADIIFIALFCYPLPIQLAGKPPGSSSILPALSLLRTIGCPLWPVLSTVYCSNTIKDSIIFRFYTLGSTRGGGMSGGPMPSASHHGGHSGIGIKTF